MAKKPNLLPPEIINAAASSSSGSSQTSSPNDTSLSALNDKVKGTRDNSVISGISKADNADVNRPKRSRSKKISENTISKSFLNTSKKIYDLMKQSDGQLLKIFNKTLKIVKEINDTQKLQLKQQILDNRSNYVLFKNIVSLLKKENMAVENQLKILTSEQKDVIEQAGVDRKRETEKGKKDIYTKVYNASTRKILPTTDARELMNMAGGNLLAATISTIKKATSRKQEDDSNENNNPDTENGIVNDSISSQLFDLKKSIEKIPESIKSIEIVDTLKSIKNHITELIDEVVIIKKIMRKLQPTNQTDSTTNTAAPKEEGGSIIGAIALFVTSLLGKLQDKAVTALTSIMTHGITGIIKNTLSSLTGVVIQIGKAMAPILMRSIIPFLVSSLPVLGIAAGLTYIAYGLNEAYEMIVETKKIIDDNNKLNRELKEKIAKTKQDINNDPNKSKDEKTRLTTGQDILDLSEKIDTLEREKKQLEMANLSSAGMGPEASEAYDNIKVLIDEKQSKINELKKQKEKLIQSEKDLKNKQKTPTVLGANLERLMSDNEYKIPTPSITDNISTNQSQFGGLFSGLNNKTNLNQMLSLSNLVTAARTPLNNTVVNAPTNQVYQSENTVVSPHMYRNPNPDLYYWVRSNKAFYP